MAEGETKRYDEAMDALSSLITKRSRADKTNKGDRFDLLFDYLKILELEEAVARMKIIHVAGTKGKGSTCTFTESILRNCGFRTGLFTSPHLIDVRERFRLNGEDICKEKFLAYFWWCYHKLKENVTEDVPMPTFFRFIALLAFKIFADEQVDVAILEVGLGGRFDATNVVQVPVVCGIASLGYDHMEILGNTLGQIAGEKAGIFKDGVPAFTVAQPEEAMSVLEQKAAELNVDLRVVPPLDAKLLNGQKLGLEGDHQYVNAGLAIALSSLWLQRTGHCDVINLGDTSVLPQEFVRGITTASMQGRAQIFHDQITDSESHGDLVFYLDGAHSPESMDVCAKWFSLAIKGACHNGDSNNTLKGDLVSERRHSHLDKRPRQNLMRILLFNCMNVRDPQELLPRLVNTCASHGVHFNKALFVPNISVYYKIGAPTSITNDPQVDLSWQYSMQKIFENLIQGSKGSEAKKIDTPFQVVKDSDGVSMRSSDNSIVFSSLPLAIKWLRDRAQQNRTLQLQVLVTGSLHLVGDVLRLMRK